MRIALALLVALAGATLLGGCGHEYHYTEDCVCDAFGCDCIRYDEHYYKAGDPAYDEAW